MRDAVARSEALLATARPNPEAVEPLGPQKYLSIAAFDDATADASPIVRSRGVKVALERARGRGLDASGFFETGARWSAIANSKGNFGFHRSTSAGYSATMRTADGTGSGYAAVDAPRLADVDAAALAERAAIKAETSAKPRDLPPGKYPVILEPHAVADLLVRHHLLIRRPLRRGGPQLLFQARRRHAAGREGLRRHRHAALRPDRPARSRLALGRRRRAVRRGFGGGGGGGLPSRKTTWIENGVVSNLTCDRYWAKKTGASRCLIRAAWSWRGARAHSKT